MKMSKRFKRNICKAKMVLNINKRLNTSFYNELHCKNTFFRFKLINRFLM